MMIEPRTSDRRLVAFLCLVLSSFTVCCAQSAPQPNSGVQTTHAPEHPMTEEQVRTYLMVCHFPSVSRQLTHEKMEAQRKQLPPWYLSPVWDEIEKAIDDIDLPQVMTPIYQKYISEKDATWLIRLSATPQMQEVLQSVLTSDERLQHSGTAPLEARDQTMHRLAHEERDEVERILSRLSAADQRELESHQASLQAMQPLLAQLRKECSEAVLRKQSELADAIVGEHRSELVEAKRKYDADHPQNSSSSPPQ